MWLFYYFIVVLCIFYLNLFMNSSAVSTIIPAWNSFDCSLCFDNVHSNDAFIFPKYNYQKFTRYHTTYVKPEHFFPAKTIDKRDDKGGKKSDSR